MSTQSKGTGNDAASARGAAQFRYRFADADFDESTGVLSVAGVVVALEPRPTRLLVELLRHVNEVVTKEELLDTVWEGRPTVDNVVANAVNKLRKALGDEAGARVTNQPRIGYRLLGPIERIAVGRLGDNAELDLKPGQPVPHREGYRLERALGNSGRNHVWLARHSKLGQERVFKFAVDAERLRSLKREFTLYRVLSAELGDRACFAKVLDANFAEAPYFLECEYGGPDLLAWADEDERLKKLSLDERLALFVQIAEAIAAAHSVGVLHKDIKPANVLVSGEPGAWVLKVMDFGSGQIQDPGRLKDIGLTALGLTLGTSGADSAGGTPMYAAPEVVAGEALTVQADVYALGIVLWQIAANDLRLPLVPGWQRRIDDDMLRMDIAAAVDGDRQQRLSNVTDLIELIKQRGQRSLDMKRQETEAQRVRTVMAERDKQRARLPWIVGAFASLVLGAAMAAWLYWRASDALAVATEHAQRASAISDFLNHDVLHQIDLSRVGSTDAINMGDLLNRASQQAQVRFNGQPKLEAAVRRRLATVYMRTLQTRSATREFTAAIKLLEGSAPASDDDLLTSRFGLVQSTVSELLEKQAKDLLLKAEADAGPKLLGAPSELTVYAARARVLVLSATGETKALLAAAQRYKELISVWPRADLFDRFDASQLLAEAHLVNGDTVAANDELKTLQAPTFDEKSVGAITKARALHVQAKADLSGGDRGGARNKLREAIAILTTALGPSSLHVGLFNFELGNILSIDGDEAGSYECLRLAKAAFLAALGGSHSYTISITVNIAILDTINGRSQKGVDAFQATRPWFISTNNRTDAVDFYHAWALIDLGRYAEAHQLLRGIDDEVFIKLHMDDPQPYRLRLKAQRGRALVGIGQRAEGLTLFNDAMEQMRKSGAQKKDIEKFERYARLPPLRGSPGR